MKLDVKKIKQKIMKIAHKTGAGHAASALSCAELLCKVYSDMPENAIVILSKGHGALAQYVILNELGILPDKVLKTYHKNGGLSEHTTLAPEYGIYASTGSLGHGLGIGIGYALADRSRQVAVILGDGELQEGSTLEALRLIFDLEITNIQPIVDLNGVQGFQMIPKYLPAIYNSKMGEYGRPYAQYYDTSHEKASVDDHYIKITDKVLKEWTKKQS